MYNYIINYNIIHAYENKLLQICIYIYALK